MNAYIVKSGDKPPAQLKTDRLIIRISPEQKRGLQGRLQTSGWELSDYIRALIAFDEKEGLVCKN